ncbi:MAG: hypothetical protein ACLP9L_33605 [Thermoguttaceae bacterium]
MVAERAKTDRRHAMEELSPGLRDAVECVLNDPMPEELLTIHALEAVRHQIARCPRKAGWRVISWAGPVFAASIVVTALTAYYCAPQTVDGRFVKSPVLPTTGEDGAAAFSDDLPTLWAYSKAARKSPEALDALLDRQARQSIPANSRSLATTSISPFSFLRAITLL